MKEKVKAFLDEGVSLKQISKYSGIHYTTLSKWLNNERNISEYNKSEVYAALVRIADILNKIVKMEC